MAVRLNAPAPAGSASGCPLRVLHLSRWLHPVGGGIQTYLRQAMNSLEPADVEMSVAALEPGVAPPQFAGRVRYLGTAGDSRVAAFTRFWRWLGSALGDFDVVHVHGVFSAVLVAAAVQCRRRGVPFVVSPHGALEDWGMQRRRLAKRLFLAVLGRRLLRGSAALLATAPANAETVQAVDPAFRVRTLAPGVEVGAPPGADPATDGVLRVLFIGRFEPVKGIEVLLEAIRLLHERGTAVQLELVGWGEPAYTDGLGQAAARLGIGACVKFRGFLAGADKDARLRAAHVLAVPSHSESFSFASAEALAAGVPVVATERVALAPLLRERGCGTVVPAADPAALAAALARYADAGLRSDQSRRAHALAVDEFSLQRMGAALAAVYRDAVGKD